MAFVYWIRHKDHTDVFSQGYVGVTTNPVSKRFSDHLSIARNSSSKDHSTVHKAINKYGLSCIEVVTLVECNKEYAYWLEEKLRPKKGMAWNVAAGGENNTAGMISGRKLTPEHVAKLKVANSNPTDVTRARKREGQLRRFAKKDAETLWTSEIEYTKKLRKGMEVTTSFWRNPKIPMESLHKIHAKADALYDFYFSNNENIQISAAIKFLGLIDNHRPAVGGILRRFRSGWVPLEDNDWVEDFKGEFFRANGFLAAKRKYHNNKIPEYYDKLRQQYEEYLRKERESHGT